MEGITKRFGSVLANDGVNLDVASGELHCLLGENGAGKSTLMKILGGLQQADSGRMTLEGKEIAPRSPREAARLGIGLVHQHFMLVDTLDARENMQLAHPGLRVEALAEEHGLQVPFDRPVGQLSVGERQRVEILKALGQNARVLVLDEPTAVLTPQEAERLFAVLREMAASGKSIIFISHKLPEVLALCHRVTVLRQGQTVACEPLAGATQEQLAGWMVGRDFQLDGRRAAVDLGEPRLVLEGLAAPGLAPCSLTVRRGEILGVAGVSGNGQTQLAEALAGLWPATGSVRLDGLEIGSLGVLERLRAGLAYVPEERNGVGAVLPMTVAENAVLRDAPSLSSRGWLSPAVVAARALSLVEALDVRCAGVEARASSLSGGNLQKLIVARELARQPKALIAAQPTRGVDVGAIVEIHRRLLAERSRGLATLLISEDLDELRRLSDRIAVMYSGKVAAVVDGETPAEELGLLMAGGGA